MIIPSLNGSPKKVAKKIKRKYSVASYQTQYDNADSTQLFTSKSEEDVSDELASSTDDGQISDEECKDTGLIDNRKQDEGPSVDKDGNCAESAETEEIQPPKLERTVTLKEYRQEMMMEHGIQPQQESSHQDSTGNSDHKSNLGRKWSLWSLFSGQNGQKDGENVESMASMKTGGISSVKSHEIASINTNHTGGEVSGGTESSILTYHGNTLSQIDNEDNLEPNTLSRVVTSTGEGVEEDLENEGEGEEEQSGFEDEESKPGMQKHWWKPWSWYNSNELNTCDTAMNGEQTLQEEDEEEKNLRESEKEAQRVMDARTLTYEVSSSWAYFRDESEDTGQISIFGTRSMRAPLTVRHNVKCGFDKQEKHGPILDSDDLCTVIPDFDRNYRDITTQTKIRILISSLGGSLIKMLVAGETHLYHRPGETTNAEKMVRVASSELGKWANDNDVIIKKQTIALDGYGQLFDRVSNCLSLLDNWMNSICSADIILVVSDVQSTAIAIHVLSRLITAGYLDNTAFVGFIGLAGTFLGPSLDADTKITVKGSGDLLENKVMLQLFDFQDCNSLQGKELLRHIKILVGRNVKITLVASLTDTLAPIYSSLCLHISHPNIFRAVYIDGRSGQPDFIITLISLALTIRNLNMNDHRLLVELSSIFQASSWEYRKRRKSITNKSGNYTNTIFTNRHVYKTGIQNMLETSDLMFKQVVQEQEDFDVKEMSTNVYHIPWCMRGFIEELAKLKKKEDRRTDRHFDVDTGQLINQLLEEFRAWRPTDKVYKDFRYCIEELSEMSGNDLFGD
ncbi:hypothetical protein HII13_003858 [Brettanomyces bruxellensis]|nr:hypothetical protein HII13_003858 [Brettanomyces bruxellensis]